MRAASVSMHIGQTFLQQAQDALAARESQLRAIMDGVPAPVAYLDRDERCQYVNKPFLQYFGLTAEQVPRLHLKWAFGFPDATSAWAQPTIAGGRVFVEDPMLAHSPVAPEAALAAADCTSIR